MARSPSRRERTREALQRHALTLFEAQGYERTSAAGIAAAAGVSEMTFFRHFATKERVLLDDPYDPVLVAAVAEQPVGADPLTRVVAGLQSAWAEVPEAAVDVVRRRTRVIAATPTLRGAIWRNTQQTEDLVADQLVADGTAELEARAAVTAVLAAVTSALLWWSAHDEAGLAECIQRALALFDRPGR